MKKLGTILLIVLLMPLSLLFSGCGKSAVKILIYGYKTEFNYGDKFSLGDGFFAVVKYDTAQTKQLDTNNLIFKDTGDITKNKEIIVDYSAYKGNELGSYPIYIKYANDEEVLATYTVSVNIIPLEDEKNSIQPVSTGFSGNYDGREHTITVMADSSLTIKYGLTENECNSDTPFTFKNAGTHIVFFEVSKYGYESFKGSETVEIKPLQLNVAIDKKEITYGEEVGEVTAVHTGFLYGENEEVLGGELSYTTDYINGESDAGVYTITPCGYETQNYEINYISNTLTVKKAESELSVVINDTTYGTAFNPQILKNTSGGAMSYQFRKLDKTVYESGFPKDSGEYEILCISAETKNYNQQKVRVNPVLINRAVFTITCKSYTLYYNGDLPDELEVEYSELFYKDTLADFEGTLVITTSYRKGVSYVGGQYITSARGLQNNENYKVEFVNGTVTVLHRPNVLTVEVADVEYGKTFSPTITENESGNSVVYKYRLQGTTDYTEDIPTAVGIYDVMAYQEQSQNYGETIVEILGCSITRKVISEVDFDSLTFTYDGTVKNPIATIKSSDICYDDECSVDVKCENSINASVLPYTVKVIGLSNDSYILSNDQTNLIKDYYITKANIKLPTIEEKVYNGQVQKSGLESNDLYLVNCDYGGIISGSYYVELLLKDTINYAWENLSTDMATIWYDIEKANNSVSNLNISKNLFTITEEIELPTCETAYGKAEFEFKLRGEDDAVFISDLPTQVGDYYIRPIIAMSENYNEFIGEEYLEIRIIQAPIPYTPLNILTAPLNSTLSTITLPVVEGVGYWEFINESLVLSTEGMQTVYADFVPYDTVNYLTNENIPIYIDVYDETNGNGNFSEEDIDIREASYDYGLTNSYELTAYLSGDAAQASVSYSLSPNGVFTENISLTGTNEDIKTHDVWVKISKEGFNPYYCKSKLTINDVIVDIEIDTETLNFNRFIPVNTSLNLEKLIVKITYASSKIIEESSSVIESTTFNQSVLGTQYIDITVYGTKYSSKLAVEVYEPVSDFIFTAGNLTSTYNSQDDLYVLNNVSIQNLGELNINYGTIYGVFEVDEDNFVYENNLIALNGGLSNIKITDSHEFIIVVVYDSVEYRLNLTISRPVLLVKDVIIGNEIFDITLVNQSISVEKDLPLEILLTNVEDSIYELNSNNENVLIEGNRYILQDSNQITFVVLDEDNQTVIQKIIISVSNND